MMEEQLISFKIAERAKKAGFNMLTQKVYNENGRKFPFNSGLLQKAEKIPASTQSLLQKWLREEHKISIKIDDYTTDGKIRYDYSVEELGSQKDDPQGVYETYEEALEDGLNTALRQIKL